MIFPANPASDPYTYMLLSHTCSMHLSSLSDIANNCYNAYRPLGIILYYAILLKLFPDQITFNYIVLALNICFTIGVFAILNKIFNINNNFIKKLIIFGFILANVIGLIPITMSDLIALYFFLMGISFLTKLDLSNIDKSSYYKTFFVGLFFALAILFKQNYAGYSLFILIPFFIFNIHSLSNQLKISLKLILTLSLGLSLILIQFINVYMHSNAFWLYEPKVMALTTPLFHQPYIEFFTYTTITPTNLDFSPGAYVTVLSSHINNVMFILYKWYVGMSKIDIIYHGIRPAVTNVIIVNPMLYIKPLLFLSFFLGISVITIIFGESKPSKYLIILAFIISIFSATIMHIENRYFILPRLILILCTIDCIIIIYKKIKLYK